jgi:hypothetical protein
VAVGVYLRLSVCQTRETGHNMFLCRQHMLAIVHQTPRCHVATALRNSLGRSQVRI